MARDLLARYLRDRKESQRAFERRIGAQPGQVSRYLSGARKPNGRLATVIEDATAGVVPARSWWEQPRKPRRRAVPAHA